MPNKPRTDLVTRQRVVIEYTESSRPDRQLIRKALGASEESKRLYYIKIYNDPITLSDFLKICIDSSREGGIFLDRYAVEQELVPPNLDKKTDPYFRYLRNSPICIFTGDSNSNQRINLTHKADSLNVGSHISYPFGDSKRYLMIAHTHPTKTNRANQITRDMTVADNNQVEIAINWDGDIFLYSEGCCYNKVVRASEKLYSNVLSNGQPLPIDINTPITPEITQTLNRLLPHYREPFTYMEGANQVKYYRNRIGFFEESSPVDDEIDRADRIPTTQSFS